MSFEPILLAVFSVVALAFFSSGRYPGEFVALFLLAALLVSGLVTPKEAFSGFSHSAVILVGAFLVLSESLVRTGAVGIISRAVFRHSGARRILVKLVSLVVASSAWLSNTAITALFIPIIRELRRDKGILPSKYLIPLSYAAVIGGSFTVIGSSTNIFAVSLYQDFTGRSIPIFSLLPFGLIFFSVFVLYLTFWGFRRLPEIVRDENPLENVDLRDFLVQARILPGSPLLGQNVLGGFMRQMHDLVIVGLERRGEIRFDLSGDPVLGEGDRILLRGEPAAIAPLAERLGLMIEEDLTIQKEGHASGRIEYVNTVIGPNSRYIGRQVARVGFFQRLGSTVIAVCRRNRERRRRVGDIILRFGDVLLVQGPPGTTEAFEKSRDFILQNRLELPVERRRKLPFGIFALALVVLTGIVMPEHLTAAAFVGAVFVVLTGCLTPGEARRALGLNVILLIAALIPYAMAFERTGLADTVARMVVATGGAFGPRGAFLVVMLAGSMLGHLIHPNGVHAVMIPLSIATARSLGVDAVPFVVGMIYSSIYVFASPFSYNTNAMVTAEAGYTAKDFARVGAPLVLIFHVLAWWLIPVFFPFVAAPR